MAWVRFEDGFPFHRKVRRLSDAAFRLNVSAICWCSEHLTDGHVPSDDLSIVSDVKRPANAAAELVRVGLWDEVDGGWQVHDYLDYNPSAAKVRKDREARAERLRKWREKQARNGVTDTDGDESHDVP